MTSSIVYDGVQRTKNESELANTLFTGQKLWFAHTVPLRKWLIENAQNNGAVVVAMDTDADVRLVDHAKKNNAPGTHSFKYVENSIRRGVRENLADHAVGVATRVSRPVGSTTTAPKHGRTPFTNQDDQQLWDWVKPYEDSGGYWKGNEIYKQLESINPRHTFQSWRDRWMKTTRYQNRTSTPLTDQTQPIPESSTLQASRSAHQRKRRRQDTDDPGRGETEVDDTSNPISIRDDQPVKISDQKPGSPSPRLPPRIKAKESERIDHLDRSPGKKRRAEPREIEQDNGQSEIVTGSEIPSHIGLEEDRQPFSIDEAKQLYHLVPKLTNVSAANFQEAWAVLASSEDWTGHTPKEWQIYFENFILPEYCRRNKLTITEVAPYLTQGQELPGPSTPKKGARSNARTDGDRINPDMNACGLCHELGSASWHRDNEGRRVCNKCAIFLRVAGVPRPSTSLVEVIDDSGDEDLSRRLADARTPRAKAKPWPISTPASNYVHRGTSPIISNQDLELPEKGSPRFANLKSPLLRPDSPSLARVPEPNEARKRSTGRGSQSQSTSQESNKTDSQSKGTELVGKQPQLQDAIPGPHEVLKRPETSTTNQTTPLSDSIPASQLSTKGKRDRYRLRDEAGNFDDPIQSSMRSKLIPSREPAKFSTVNSIVEDDDTLSPQVSTASPQKYRHQTPLSQPSLPEDYEEDGPVDPSAIQGSSRTLGLAVDPLEAQTSPISVHLVSDDDTSGVSRSVSSSLESLTRILAPIDRNPQSRSEFEMFDTAPETLDDFDSAVEEQQEQPDLSSRPVKSKERRLSTQALFNNIGDGLEGPYLDLELPEPEGGWQKALGYDPDELTDQELNQQEQRGQALSRTKGKSKATIKDEPKDDSTLAYLRLPSPPSQRRSKSEPSTTLESGGPQTSRWFAAQEAIHTGIHRLTLNEILFKALELTSFDFELASEVVVIILEQVSPKFKRRDKFVPGLEINIPENLPGVWTSEDDNLLMSHDTEDLLMVMEKHGKDGCDARFGFLGQWVES
jgi:hypothetical protein